MPRPPDPISRLPPPSRLRALMQALAVLDAILSPEWVYRYYSFDARWGEGQAMGSMRNGQGDDLFALFDAAGVFIKGLDHERLTHEAAPGALYSSVPPVFEAGVNEPAFSPDRATFCCWRGSGDEGWNWSSQGAPDGDGSDWMLSVLDGDPESYLDFARQYYEVELDLDLVRLIYRHAPITPELAGRLNPDIDFEALQADLEEIGYPASPA